MACNRFISSTQVTFQFFAQFPTTKDLKTLPICVRKIFFGTAFEKEGNSIENKGFSPRISDNEDKDISDYTSFSLQSIVTEIAEFTRGQSKRITSNTRATF